MSTTGPPGPALACPGCGSPDVDLRRGLLCGTCAEAVVTETTPPAQPEAALGRVAKLAESWAALAIPGASDDVAAEIDALCGRELLDIIHGGGDADGRLARISSLAEGWERPGSPGLFYPAAGQCVLDAIRGASTDEEAGWRARAEAAEARLAELENAICWNTSCTSCARVLDSAYAETVRREAAEAALAAIKAECRGHLERAGAERGSVCCPHLAEDILAIAGDEEAALARRLVAQAEAADAKYKVAAVRAAVYTFLHQYGRSELPTFKVAIDLAVSLRRIVDNLGSEEENGDA